MSFELRLRPTDARVAITSSAPVGGATSVKKVEKQTPPGQIIYRVQANELEEAVESIDRIVDEIAWPNMEDIIIEIRPKRSPIWVDLFHIIEQKTGSYPEYEPGKFIIEAMPTGGAKADYTIDLAISLRHWNGGSAYPKLMMTTNLGQQRASDVSWWPNALTTAQKMNVLSNYPMPALWIEICFTEAEDSRDYREAFDKITQNAPTATNTLFVAVALLKDIDSLMAARANVNAAEPIPVATTPANQHLQFPLPAQWPYVVVWPVPQHGKARPAPQYYLVRRGLHVDLHVPGVVQPYQLSMDLIIESNLF